MRPRIQRRCFSLKTTYVAIASICLCLTAASTFAATNHSRVLIRSDVSRSHRNELVTRLRVITGLIELKFDGDGSLRLEGNHSIAGSESARALLAKAVAGENVIVLEDASSRSDVAFCRVVQGRWTQGDSNKPPAYVVLIDFEDFHELSGDAEARAAFDVGWGLLHEIDHVVTGSEDSSDAGVTGECEDHINSMRLEVALPIRADYFFRRVYVQADTNFKARYVRLSFEQRDALQTKRYWLVWDAVSVGGLPGDGQRALVR